MSQVAYLTVGKREQTKVQNRQAILDAAREVFGELGYEAATVRDIIRRTGLAAGTFYNYYRSKEEVERHKKYDPILRFEDLLLKNQIASESDFVQIKEDIISEVVAATMFALDSEEPHIEELFTEVYAE